ncbi:hypothetical protein D3C71_1732680 [compost metagenome]
MLDHQRQRPFAPFLVRDADDRDLVDRRVHRDDVFQRERGNPFAPGLDDVLDAVGHAQVAALIDVADVAGVQVTTGPQGC